MMNRCDSVDALMYAYYVYMKRKEENRMLEKDKNCIEFSMRSMIATHKHYQEDTEIAITGMAPGKSLLFAINPFDIPCDVVVIPKRAFERLQTENEQLKKKLEEFSPVPGYREFLKALYPETSESDIEKVVWVTEQVCCGRDLQHALQTDLQNHKRFSSIQAKSIRSWKEATGCSTPEEAKELIDGKKRRVTKLQDQLTREGKTKDTTSDTISKTETVEHLRRMLEATVPNTDYDEGFIDGVEFGISTVSTMPSAQPEQI